MDITKTSSSHMPSMTSHLPAPNHGLEVAGRTGHNVLWTIFAAMLLSTVLFWGVSLRKAKRDRAFYYITGLITMFAAVSYYSMAVGLGAVLVPARGHGHAFREVLVARYADWMVTTPLLLLDLALFAGVSPIDIISLVVFDILMIVTGYLGANTKELSYRMGFYAMSCAFMLLVFAILVINGGAAARARGDKVRSAYFILTIFTIVLWCGYPVIWFFSEGINAVHSDTEIIVYSILDVLAKPGFGVLLLAFHAKLDDFEPALPAWLFESYGGQAGAVRLDD